MNCDDGLDFGDELVAVRTTHATATTAWVDETPPFRRHSRTWTKCRPSVNIFFGMSAITQRQTHGRSANGSLWKHISKAKNLAISGKICMI